MTTIRISKVALLAVLAAASLRSSESLNRSLYMPIEFRLCEHLTDAVFYQDGAAVSSMPASRIFQFTYYPHLERVLPGEVAVRVEGRYRDGEAFVAALAVSPGGVHSAHRTLSADTARYVEKQKHKIDVRLRPKTVLLRCPRFCKKAEASPTP